MLKITVFLVSFMGFQYHLHAWGLRGHQIAGHQAARIMKAQNPKSSLNKFYSTNSLFISHHSNSPDVIWKNSNEHPKWAKENFPTHYLDIEHLLGPLPKDNNKSYFEKIKKLPPSFKELKEKYNNYVSPITGKKINLKKDLGTTPWYIKQNFNNLVATFKCLKTKKVKFKMYPQYKLPIEPNKNNSHFICKKNGPAYNDLYASLVYSAIISHYVADLAVPYHNSLDFDGRLSGNAGIHSYWESLIVNELGDDLESLVHKKAMDSKFKKEIKKNIFSKDLIQMVFNLSAESLPKYKKIIQLDNKHAIKKKSYKFKANRKKPNDKNVLKANKSLIVNRLATAASVLSLIYELAYEQGGKPNLSKVTHHQSFPSYKPIPFVWPEY